MQLFAPNEPLGRRSAARCALHRDAHRQDDAGLGHEVVCKTSTIRPLLSPNRKRSAAPPDPTYLVYTLGKLGIMKLRSDYKLKVGTSFTLQQSHERVHEIEHAAGSPSCGELWWGTMVRRYRKRGTGIDGTESSQGSISSGRIGNAFSSRHQGAAERNAAFHRQAGHSVRRGRGSTFGLRPDHHGDPPRQEQHRRSLRRRRATSWGSSKRRWSSPSSATILAMTFAKYLKGLKS